MSGRFEERAHVGIAVVVGAIGGAVGFKHSHDWAIENGQESWIAWAVAVVIECMAIVAGLELKRRRGGFPLLVLVGAFLLQMSAQVANARPTVAGWIIAATPALGFLCIVKMLLTRLSEQPAAEPAPVEVPQVEPVRPVPAEAVRVEEPVAELLAPAPAPVQTAAVATPAAVWPPAA
ncbi:DUF2637 domain-containing protein [Lentzea sp. NPDC058450]|uniref:DUF2637 domain-containing protein n=1 Tax=Lentzea sp. NPDC058450 TaxID=3346505 RepID=UPI003653E2C7